MKILSTKKLKGGELERAWALGLKVDDFDFIEIRFFAANEVVGMLGSATEVAGTLGMGSVLVFTSMNAVKGVEGLVGSAGWSGSVYCLGPRTKSLVERAGWKVRGTAKDSLGLAERILEDVDVREVVFVCGRKRLSVLPDRLREAGVLVREWFVYDTILTPRAVDLGVYDGVLFFSPSGVESFLSLYPEVVDLVCFVVGDTTGGYLKDRCPGVRMVVGRESSVLGVIEAVGEYFDRQYNE